VHKRELINVKNVKKIVFRDESYPIEGFTPELRGYMAKSWHRSMT
jgi:hypothetical protein